MLSTFTTSQFTDEANWQSSNPLQETGQSETAVMSQKAVTNIVNNLRNSDNDLSIYIQDVVAKLIRNNTQQALTPSEILSNNAVKASLTTGKGFVGRFTGSYVAVYNIAGITGDLNIKSTALKSTSDTILYYYAFFSDSNLDTNSYLEKSISVEQGSGNITNIFNSVAIPDGANYLVISAIEIYSVIESPYSVNDITIYEDIATIYENMDLLNRKVLTLEYWGSNPTTINQLPIGTYFYNTYNNTIGLRKGETGWDSFAVEKNQLYVYNNDIFVSLNGISLVNLTDLQFKDVRGDINSLKSKVGKISFGDDFLSEEIAVENILTRSFLTSLNMSLSSLNNAGGKAAIILFFIVTSLLPFPRFNLLSSFNLSSSSNPPCLFRYFTTDDLL